MRLATVAALLLALRCTRAGPVSGRAVSFADGILAGAATAVSPAGQRGPLDVADDPADNFTDVPAAVLFLNGTDAAWGVRAGAANTPTVPDAVLAHAGAVYLLAAAGTPTLYKYTTEEGGARRVFRVSLGSPGDSFQLMAAAAAGPGQCARLVVAATLLPGSKLLEGAAAGPRVAVVVLDACTGAVAAPAVPLVAMPAAAGVQMLERVHGLSVSDGAAYVATQLVRVTNAGGARISTANPVIHRVELGSGDVTTRILPVLDCASVRVHAGVYVHVALDRHAAILKNDKGVDAVEIYRLDARTLANLKWGSVARPVDVLQPFSARLPLRASDRWTRVVSMGFLTRSNTIALLLHTTETADTWDAITATAPTLDFNFPTKARMMLVPDAVPNGGAAADALATSPGPEETKGPVTVAFPELSLRQSMPGLTARPLLLLVDDNATILARMYDLLNTTFISAIIPGTPMPAAGSDAALALSEMAVDAEHERAYVIGSVVEPGKDERLLYLNISLPSSGGAGVTPIPSPSPISNGSGVECIGASSRTFEGRSVTALIALNQQLRMQKHVRRWWRCCKSWVYRVFGSAYDGGQDGCEKPVEIEMLCYEWVPEGKEVDKAAVPKEKGRLCATPNHVVIFEGKMTYMRDFCNYPTSKKCSVQVDTPVNFKGECGEHIVVAKDLIVTQHVGDIEKETASEAADRECRAIRSAKLLWKVRSL